MVYRAADIPVDCQTMVDTHLGPKNPDKLPLTKKFGRLLESILADNKITKEDYLRLLEKYHGIRHPIGMPRIRAGLSRNERREIIGVWMDRHGYGDIKRLLDSKLSRHDLRSFDGAGFHPWLSCTTNGKLDEVGRYLVARHTPGAAVPQRPACLGIVPPEPTWTQGQDAPIVYMEMSKYGTRDYLDLTQIEKQAEQKGDEELVHDVRAARAVNAFPVFDLDSNEERLTWQEFEKAIRSPYLPIPHRQSLERLRTRFF